MRGGVLHQAKNLNEMGNGCISKNLNEMAVEESDLVVYDANVNSLMNFAMNLAMNFAR